MYSNKDSLLFFFFVIALLLLPFQKGECRKGEPSPLVTSIAVAEEEGPWFTGPLLSPSSSAVPVGYTNIEPYFFATVFMGDYDKHWKIRSRKHNFYSYATQVIWQLGLTDFMDFFMSPLVFYNRTQDESSFEFGDLQVGFDFQLLQETTDNYSPSIKVAVRESFPTGKYNRLKASKKGTDAVGTGSYTTAIAAVIGRLFHFKSLYYLNARLAGVYSITSNAHVHNLSVYGGGQGTRGTVHVGNGFSSFLGLEFSLSRNWAFALDVTAFFTDKSTFSGKRGFIAPRVPARVGLHSSTEYSMAPAIEYNWNAQLGIIAGAWFTFAGRNTPEFASAVIALNYYGPIKAQKKKPGIKYPGGGGGGSNVSHFEFDSKARRLLASFRP